MSGTDLTILVAFAAGVISFLSPCVLPLVPAYLGQLTAIAVAANASGLPPSRWTAMRHALAYVAGFGRVFTLLGITATFAAGPLVDYLPALRMIGGVILIVLGPQPGRASSTSRSSSGPGGRSRPARRPRWRRPPARSRFASAVADAVDRRPARRPRRQPGRRLARVVRARCDLRHRLDAVHRDHPRRDPDDGRVVDDRRPGRVLLVAYTLGLGLPFLLIAAVYDRAPRVMAPLVRHGRVVSLIGGLLVALIGVAMLFDWLAHPAALLHVQHGHLSDGPTRVQPPPGAPRPGRPVQRPPAGARHDRDHRGRDRARRRDHAARQHRRATGPVDPRATAYLISSPPPVGLKVGQSAPEFAVTAPDGSTGTADRPRRRPIRLADLRGKAVWVNFWATWCPPCQAEMPILRELSERYKDRGLELVAVSVQETSPADVAAYAARYGLGYTIGFDGTGQVFRAYKGYGLPTQVFIDANGVIAAIVGAPLDEAGAAAQIERILPRTPGRQPSGPSPAAASPAP